MNQYKTSSMKQFEIKTFWQTFNLEFSLEKDPIFNRLETFETQNMPTIHLISLGDPYCIFSYR